MLIWYDLPKKDIKKENRIYLKYLPENTEQLDCSIINLLEKLSTELQLSLITSSCERSLVIGL
jgi:hypothetical protein